MKNTKCWSLQFTAGRGHVATLLICGLVLANATARADAVALDDVYLGAFESTMSVAAPGVLANDSASSGSLIASLMSPPSHGLFTFTNNGGFSYQPGTGFAGIDYFTYQAVNGVAAPNAATVVLITPPVGKMFQDDFTTTPVASSPLPWTQRLGAWSRTNGMMLGSSQADTYGYACFTNPDWADYVVQADLRFPSTAAFGGGIGGRLDPATGAHYAAWIYPENSGGGSSILKIVKFHSWTDPNWALLGEVPLSTGVGTNWHNVRLAFNGNRIFAFYDGVLAISVTDNGSVDSQPAYMAGGICAELWTDFLTPYELEFRNVSVAALVADDGYSVCANTRLTVPAPGILANDTDVIGTNLVATLITGPAHGTLTLTTNGGFSYMPADDYMGQDSFTYLASDRQNVLGAATATINIVSMNIAIRSITLTNGVARITWDAVEGHTYRLLKADNPATTIWTPVPPDVVATNSTASCEESLGPAQMKFYRVFLVE